MHVAKLIILPCMDEKSLKKKKKFKSCTALMHKHVREISTNGVNGEAETTLAAPSTAANLKPQSCTDFRTRLC